MFIVKSLEKNNVLARVTPRHSCQETEMVRIAIYKDCALTALKQDGLDKEVSMKSAA